MISLVFAWKTLPQIISQSLKWLYTEMISSKKHVLWNDHAISATHELRNIYSFSMLPLLYKGLLKIIT